MEIFNGILEFQWDEGNQQKNATKHGVVFTECEEVFFNRPLLLQEDRKHSHSEQRTYVLGRTNTNRLLFVVFTVRGTKIRVISARDMNRKEKGIYEQSY